MWDSLPIFLLATTAILNLVIGFIVLSRTYQRQYGWFFAVTVFSIAAWCVGDILLLVGRGDSLSLGLILFYFFPSLVPISIFLFSYTFPKGNKVKNNTLLLVAALTTCWLVFLCIDPYILLREVTENKNSFNTPIVNPVSFLLYTLYFSLTFIPTYILLFLKAKKQNNEILKSQVIYSLYGVLGASIIGMATNLSLPLMGNAHYIWAGPIATLLYIGVTTYLIVKYHLFDIRYIVFRFVVYSLSLAAVFTFVFSVLNYIVINLLLTSQPISIEVQLLYALIAIAMVSTFSSIKKIIDKATNRLFFRQTYSTHKAAGLISSYAAKSISPENIQNQSIKVFNNTITPEYAVFIIANNNKVTVGAYSGNVPEYIIDKTEDFYKVMVRLKHKNTFKNTAEDTAGKVADIFSSLTIGSITKLNTYNKMIGLLVLGEKKNGTSYSGHDSTLLELAANDLALGLENAQRYEEIQAFNKTLQYKINEATKALKRTNAKLIALDDAKDEFISMASHQLRTPLTSVKGYISMILEEDLGKINDSQRQALKEAFDSSQRMVFLISDFLNVSRIRTGKFLIESKPTDLSQIVSEEILQLRDMAGLKGQEIVYKAPKKFPIVSLDENKTRQVMMNMLDNAIFYTPRDGKITIVLEQTKDEVKYTVTDNGIGVPEKEQHRLFTKFFRAENARKARPDGTGLGLFMAQKIITAQGGSIIFKSKEGEGSTFGFNLPLGKSDPSIIDK